MNLSAKDIAYNLKIAARDLLYIADNNREPPFSPYWQNARACWGTPPAAILKAFDLPINAGWSDAVDVAQRAIEAGGMSVLRARKAKEAAARKTEELERYQTKIAHQAAHRDDFADHDTRVREAYAIPGETPAAPTKRPALFSNVNEVRKPEPDCFEHYRREHEALSTRPFKKGGRA